VFMALTCPESSPLLEVSASDRRDLQLTLQV
jgi:hypothetical protein